jgi:tubulin polyglutamylase TTLL6/13
MDIKLDPEENCDWDIWWSDVPVPPEKVQKLKPHQKINANPNIGLLSRKNNLAKNLMRMAKDFPEEYNFFPKTWQLPVDASDLKAQFNKKKCKTFIIKPVHMCQGRGIYLVRTFEDIDNKSGEPLVAQRYMAKPYLIDGLKFDLRVYALVYGVDPLRLFVFQEGLARFATEEYVGP